MTIAKLLQDALQSLEAAPDGHLHLQIRRQIRAAFGEVVGVDQEGGPSDAVRALVALDHMTIERVLPYWDRTMPEDPRPHRMLELADELVNGRIEPKAAEAEQNAFRTDAEYLPPADDGGRASAAGQAAVHMVSTAFGVEFTDEDAPPGSDDDDIYPDMWDCTFYASLAEAPHFRLPEMSSEDIEARRAFWRWWLTEAVPQVAREAGIDVE